ncbi:hypothetical protein JRQ81_014066 [Phrynocephalus forsythii]|uniref:Sec16 Sec23-binding domain-containing protein n=1 Tax=Phrynocephalus forsythii TaxID=171643 RepID=A0A9Q0XWX3_9SAUR|nr:hypothetical protein JRQ81_014066 [Phrynocephalus forsythii]
MDSRLPSQQPQVSGRCRPWMEGYERGPRRKVPFGPPPPVFHFRHSHPTYNPMFENYVRPWSRVENYESSYPIWSYSRQDYEDLNQNLVEDYPYGVYQRYPQAHTYEGDSKQKETWGKDANYQVQSHYRDYYQDEGSSFGGHGVLMPIRSKQHDSYARSYRSKKDDSYRVSYISPLQPSQLQDGFQGNFQENSETPVCKLSFPEEPSLLLQYKDSGLSSSIQELSQYLQESSSQYKAAPLKDWSPPAQAEEPVAALYPVAFQKFPFFHVPVGFGAGGHLVQVCPNYPVVGQPALVEIHSLEVILHETAEQKAMQAFPGPLIRQDLHKVDMMNFCQQKAAVGCDLTTNYGRDSALMWKLLLLLCRQNGSWVGSDIAELLMQDSKHRERYKRKEPGASTINLTDEWSLAGGGNAHLLTGEIVPSAITPQQKMEKYTKLLFYGQKKEALDWAMRNQLWGHAFFLSSKMDLRTYSWVLNGFTSTLSFNDPLQTLFQLMSGRIPQASQSCGDEKWGDWRPHLAVILSNQVGDTELSNRAIVTMGDSLAGKGSTEAAHFCYLMANVPFGHYGVKTDRLVLLGNSQSQKFAHFARTECIQKTEVFEYAQSLVSPKAFIPSFQIYKLVYASRLLDYGLPAQALHYCEGAAMALLAQTDNTYPILLRQVIKEKGGLLSATVSQSELPKCNGSIPGLAPHSEFAEKQGSRAAVDHPTSGVLPSPYQLYMHQNLLPGYEQPLEASKSGLEISPSGSGQISISSPGEIPGDTKESWKPNYFHEDQKNVIGYQVRDRERGSIYIRKMWELNLISFSPRIGQLTSGCHCISYKPIDLSHKHFLFWPVVSLDLFTLSPLMSKFSPLYQHTLNVRTRSISESSTVSIIEDALKSAEDTEEEETSEDLEQVQEKASGFQWLSWFRAKPNKVAESPKKVPSAHLDSTASVSLKKAAPPPSLPPTDPLGQRGKEGATLQDTGDQASFFKNHSISDSVFPPTKGGTVPLFRPAQVSRNPALRKCLVSPSGFSLLPTTLWSRRLERVWLLLATGGRVEGVWDFRHWRQKERLQAQMPLAPPMEPPRHSTRRRKPTEKGGQLAEKRVQGPVAVARVVGTPEPSPPALPPLVSQSITALVQQIVSHTDAGNIGAEKGEQAEDSSVASRDSSESSQSSLEYERSARKGRKKKAASHRSKMRQRRDTSSSSSSSVTSSSSDEEEDVGRYKNYWEGHARVPGLPRRALRKRALCKRRERQMGRKIRRKSPCKGHPEPDSHPGEHLPRKVRKAILEGLYVDVFTLLNPVRAEPLTRSKQRSKESSKLPAAERTFGNWIRGFCQYQGVQLAGDAAAIRYDEGFRRKVSNRASVNDTIPQEYCSLRYASFDHAVSMIQSLGKVALLAKCDIQSAFQLLPVHPGDLSLLGICFQGQWYVDKAMPMGCTVSCAAFETFSTFLEWATRYTCGQSALTHYFDFLTMGKGGTGDCSMLLAGFQQLAAKLGVPLAQEKTEGPTERLTYLGIEIDTIRGISRLPSEKVQALRDTLESLLKKRKCTLKELQSLLGHLNFTCRVVTPGRAFCARFAWATAGIKAPHHHIRLTKGMKLDLQVWLEFWGHFNGKAIWQTQVASGVLLAAAVMIWRDIFKDKRITFWCDNQAVVAVINRQSSKSGRVMRLVRRLVPLCLSANVTFRAKFVLGLDNGIADSLSRFQFDRSPSWCSPPTHEDVMHYMASLRAQGVPPSRLRAHRATISFFCTLGGCQDPCRTPLIRRAMKGWERKTPKRQDNRKPITPPILRALWGELTGFCWSSYEARLFRCAFTLAFFGAFRVGELVASSRKEKGHSLALEDLIFTPGALIIRLRSSKIDQRAKESHVILKKQGDTQLCPIKAAHKYLAHRGELPGPLLQHANGIPLTHYQFAGVMQKPFSWWVTNPGILGPIPFGLGRHPRHRHRASLAGGLSRWGGAVMRLWIVGHSIVYWAGVWAKQSHWGQHLGMEEHVCITWFGNRGMHWGDLLPGLWTLFRQHGEPHGLVIQLGENDITSSRGIDLKKEMEASLLVLHSTYPDVMLFWSQLLQKRHWGGGHPGRVELLRRKLDKAIGRLITTWGGIWIKHRDITSAARDMYRADGVHLSEMGNSQWVTGVRSAIGDWVQLQCSGGESSEARL